MIVECPNCGAINELPSFEDKKGWECGELFAQCSMGRPARVDGVYNGCGLAFETDTKGNTIRHPLAGIAKAARDGIIYEGDFPTLK